MIDWRAAMATILVHAGAVLAWPAVPVWGVTTCLCGAPHPAEPIIVHLPTTLTLLSIGVVDGGEPILPDQYPILAARTECGDATAGIPMPTLIYAPRVDRRSLSGETPSLCVRVDAAGRVTRVTLRRSSGSRSLDRQALQAARRSRFAADRPGDVLMKLG